MVIFGIGIGGLVLAYVALSLGCEGATPPFGVMCGHNTLGSLIVLTMGIWFVLGVVIAFFRDL
jgi:hypothetical protein